MSLIDIPLSKLSPSIAPATEVQRSRLQARTAVAGIRLILLIAPPGFGKTTVMHQLREQSISQGERTAWLSLDASDNDAMHFLAALRAAWQKIAKDTDNQPDTDPLIRFASYSEPFTLFLDDFESIHDASVLALVRSLIDRLPRTGTIVISSRRQPDLNLSRLRAQGQLLEIDADSLRFDHHEADDYLRLRGVNLPKNVLMALYEKTEGWIAALWLASLALERRDHQGSDFIKRFSGSNKTIAEYLADNVLAHQTPDVLEFLLKTSLLRQINAPIAKTLLPHTDVDGILRQLESQNLFLVADEEGGNYRYHRLFADFLQAKLRREHPEEVSRIHLAASSWYESQGRRVSAIDHAIEGQAYSHALSLLQEHTLRFLHEGRLRLLARWFQAIPNELIHTDPEIFAAAIWVRLFTQGPTSVAAELEPDRPGAGTSPIAKAHVNAQLPLYLAMQDRYEEAMKIGIESLKQLPTDNEFADNVLRHAMANVFFVMGNRSRAHALIDEARRTPGAFNLMYAESGDGLLALQGGRLREAMARFRVAVTATSTSTHNFLGGNAWAGILYAVTLYETHDLDAAEQLINVYLPLACDVGLPGHMLGGHIIRSRIAFARGDLVFAFETLTAMENLGHQRNLPRLVVSAKVERGRLLLLQGNAQASREEFDRADSPDVWKRLRHLWLPANDTDYLTLARLRWDLHFGKADAVLPLIERELASAIKMNRQRRVIKLSCLKAIAQQRTGDPSAATETIATVLRQTCSEGFIRLLADEGPALGRLVQHFHDLLLDMPARRSDPVLLNYLQDLISAFGPLPPEDGVAISQKIALMEPLTRKELQVLQLAAEGHSNAAMAEQLELSDSTVRTHLRNINSKLSAKSRAEAVAIARRIGVIR